MVDYRRQDFVRVFNLAERVVSRHHHRRRVGRAEAQRELLRRAARAHGVGTAPDLADYFRMSMRDARVRVRELVEAFRIESRPGSGTTVESLPPVEFSGVSVSTRGNSAIAYQVDGIADHKWRGNVGNILVRLPLHVCVSHIAYSVGADC